ncbi:hypothetical protein LCGC14_1905400 [marine sediment metagenome]|uniref:Uncharacterized protein n=1 Tax=marine sediment metagenome TaxID=412755 RepID=A0A0F9FVQ4_9ZZZZ
MGRFIRRVNPKIYKERNKIIVDEFSKGHSAAAIGRNLGMSRERICQIIYQETGTTPREHLLTRTLALQNKSIEVTKRNCRYCDTLFSPSMSRHFYCSKNCRDTKVRLDQRVKDITFICSQCNKSYHPQRSSANKFAAGELIKAFCSNSCYTKAGRGNK